MRLVTKILLSASVLVALLVIFARIYFSNMPQPNNVGIGKIQPCPDSPNCVSTQAADKVHKIKPISLIKDDATATLDALETIVETMPKSTVITRTDHYLHVEFRSSFWNFVDDVEFFVNPEMGVIDSRSAARMGYSDLGVNRARFKKIVHQLHSN